MTSVSFGVFTANNLDPSADSASGRTWPVSNVMNDGGAGVASGATQQAPIAAVRVSQRAAALVDDCVCINPNTGRGKEDRFIFHEQLAATVRCSGSIELVNSGTVSV